MMIIQIFISTFTLVILLNGNVFADAQAAAGAEPGKPMTLPDFSKLQKSGTGGSGNGGSIQCQNEDGRMLKVGDAGYDTCISKLRPTQTERSKSGNDSPRAVINLGK